MDERLTLQHLLAQTDAWEGLMQLLPTEEEDLDVESTVVIVMRRYKRDGDRWVRHDSCEVFIEPAVDGTDQDE